MKYLILLSFCIFSSSIFGQDDAIDKYFEKYLDNEEFTSVFVSPKMFQMISKLDLNAIETEPEAKVAMEVIKDLKGLRVLTTEVNPEVRYKEALSMLNQKEYETLMTIRDGGENIRFWVKDDGDIINELLLLVGGSEEFVLLSFTGNIDLAKISVLANQLDIKGAKHLDKIEN